MSNLSTLDKVPDVFLVRVVPFIPKHKPRKLVNATYRVAFFLPNWKPSYSYSDTWLAYSIGVEEYEIFNPQRFRFRTYELTAFLFQWHRLCGDDEPTNFRVVSS